MDKYKQAIKDIIFELNKKANTPNIITIGAITGIVEKVSKCSGCGEILDLNFKYCPYCGKCVDEE